MCGKAMSKQVRMNAFLEACALSGFPTCVPNGFGIDRPILAIVAGKQPSAGFAVVETPLGAECQEEFGTEHDIPIFAPLAALDMHHHALTVDVADFQVGQLGAPDAGGVEGHEQDAFTRSARGTDELCDFFPAQDRWNVLGFFRIGGLGCAPALLESLGIEEPQSRKIYGNGAWRQLSFLEQFRLVFANLLGAQAVGRTMEALREIFHYPDVTAYGSFSVIATLEFLQHHFSEMGHGNTSCDPHLHQTIEQPTLNYLTRSVRRRAASFKSANRRQCNSHC